MSHKKTDTEFMWRTPWSVRNPGLSTPPTGDGDNIWHDAYIGGWQTIAPIGGPPQKYGNADLGQHTEATLMPWDVVVIEVTPNASRQSSALQLSEHHFGSNKPLL